MNGDIVESNTRLLTCWKDIANYLGKGVRTVQRWERDFGLPVRRPSGIHHKSAVIAHASDLDAWMDSQWSLRKIDKNDSGDPPLQMDDLIETSKALRIAHQTLMEQASAAVELLLESCKQLETTRRAARTPPRGWRFPERDLPGLPDVALDLPDVAVGKFKAT